MFTITVLLKSDLICIQRYSLLGILMLITVLIALIKFEGRIKTTQILHKIYYTVKSRGCLLDITCNLFNKKKWTNITKSHTHTHILSFSFFTHKHTHIQISAKQTIVLWGIRRVIFTLFISLFNYQLRKWKLFIEIWLTRCLWKWCVCLNVKTESDLSICTG